MEKRFSIAFIADCELRMLGLRVGFQLWISALPHLSMKTEPPIDRYSTIDNNSMHSAIDSVLFYIHYIFQCSNIMDFNNCDKSLCIIWK